MLKTGVEKGEGIQRVGIVWGHQSDTNTHNLKIGFNWNLWWLVSASSQTIHAVNKARKDPS